MRLDENLFMRSKNFVNNPLSLRMLSFEALPHARRTGVRLAVDAEDPKVSSFKFIEH